MLYNVGTDFMILHYLVFNILCCIALLDFVMLCHCSNTISYEATGYYFISSCNILHGNAFYDMLLTGRVLLDMVLYHTVLFRFTFCQIMFHFILIHPAVCTYIYIYIHRNIYKNKVKASKHVYARMYVYVYISTYTYNIVCIYIHICTTEKAIYTHIHTHMSGI